MMNSGLNHGSAKIFQFPAGGRSAFGQARRDEAQSAVESAARVNPSACSGSWYHEAAIQESKPVRER